MALIVVRIIFDAKHGFAGLDFTVLNPVMFANEKQKMGEISSVILTRVKS